MGRLALCVATMRTEYPGIYPGDVELAVQNATVIPSIHVQYNTAEHNLGVVGSYDKLYHQSTEDILAFLHDDVLVREKGWDQRILKEFDDEQVGLAGFGGALWHGENEIYKTPYRLTQLRRGDYLSNVDDAEVHGQRFTTSGDVAVLDGYALIVRRRILERINGFIWIPDHASFFCYDYALCAMVRRLGYRIRAVGIRCHHRGGGTSVDGQGSIAKEITSPKSYDHAHRWFYDEFRDVMPYRVHV